MLGLPWTRALFVASVALLGATLVAGCGEDEGAGEDPEKLLRETFSEGNEVKSGVLDASYEFRLEARDSEETQSVSVSGPFQGEGKGRAADLALAVAYGLEGGQEQHFELITTHDAGYINFEGESYAVEPAVFRQFKRGAPLAGLEFERWFVEPSNEGTEEVEGTETTQISGGANARRLVRDLVRAARRIGLRPGGDFAAARDSFDEATIDAFTGAEDRLLRRLDLSLAWDGELEGGEQFEARIDFSLSFDQVNEDQEIEAPDDARPVSELVDELPFELSGLGEFLSGGPEGDSAVPGGAEPKEGVAIPRRGAHRLRRPPRRCPDRAVGALPLGEGAAKRAERFVLRREDPSEEPEAEAVPSRKAGARGANVRYLCGSKMAARTMVVFVHRAAFDRGPNKSASLGQGVFFVSRFPEGYRIWYSPHP